MPATTIRVRHDFKYSPQVWRADVQESFQKTKQSRTDYTVVDGQIVKTIETTWSFASAIAEVSPQIPEPPATFLYFDRTYRKEAAFQFQKTHIRTTTYEQYGDTSYLLTIEDFDVLTGKITRSISIVDGKMPLAPTVGSALSNLIQTPITSDLEDNCAFIGSKTTIDNSYLENGSDAARAARRALQRATAIVRTVTHAANPLMKLGHTVRLVAAKRGLDARHVLVRRTITLDENGAAQQTSDLEYWTR